MASELPLPSSVEPVVAREPQCHDLDFKDVGGVSLHTLNVTTAVSLGIQVGEAAIRQILSGGPGPLGPKRDGR